MRYVALLVILFFLAGCKVEPPPVPPPGVLPPPQIEVDIKESTQGLSFIVILPGNEATQPTSEQRWRQTIQLNLAEEELGSFRKEVEFLLGRIDEAQQKQEKRNSEIIIPKVQQ